MSEYLVDIKDERLSFFTPAGEVKALGGVSIHLKEGEVLGIVGESGSGKSVTAYSLMGLTAYPGRLIGGTLDFNGHHINDMSEKEMRRIRGNEVSIIFQDPMTSLNPVLTVEDQIQEVLQFHNHSSLTRAQMGKKVEEMLELVGIPAARKTCYPHEFSGGMKQRVVIAMALACNPRLLIADEPTTALDVTIQAQVLGMMEELKERFGTSMLLITHDLGVVAQTCDRVAIMYAGEIVEHGTIEDIFTGKEHHPYTQGLFGSIPSMTGDARRLNPIAGLMPDPTNLPHGCKFHTRCPHCMEVCRQRLPQVYREGTHEIACHLYGGDGKPGSEASCGEDVKLGSEASCREDVKPGSEGFGGESGKMGSETEGAGAAGSAGKEAGRV